MAIAARHRTEWDGEPVTRAVEAIAGLAAQFDFVLDMF